MAARKLLDLELSTRRKNKWTLIWKNNKKIKFCVISCSNVIKRRKEKKPVWEGSRVDVSETFSADQLWFRTISGLFQRCSLPENLWTALIQLWTALKTKDSELNSADFLWNSYEQRWFLTDSEWQFLVHFPIFSKFLEVPQPNLRKEVNYQNLGIQSAYGPKM